MAVGPVGQGWYPAEPGTLRYWDGTAWTDHYAPAAVGPNPSSAQGTRTDLRVLAIVAVAMIVCGVLVALVWGMSAVYGVGDSEPVITITQPVR
jgi:hypothetical protein